MTNNKRPFRGCCPLTLIQKPPKQRCIYPLPKPPKQRCIYSIELRVPQEPPEISQPQSAFRAIKTIDQTNIGGGPTKVEYDTQQFDLNNEYDPTTSTFMPMQDGVYLIIASLNFTPFVVGISYMLNIEIHLNGDRIAYDNEQFSNPELLNNVFSVSTIYQLNAGDRIEVFASTSAPGGGETLEDEGTHFEAARFPSPQ